MRWLSIVLLMILSSSIYANSSFVFNEIVNESGNFGRDVLIVFLASPIFLLPVVFYRLEDKSKIKELFTEIFKSIPMFIAWFFGGMVIATFATMILLIPVAILWNILVAFDVVSILTLSATVLNLIEIYMFITIVGSGIWSAIKVTSDEYKDYRQL